MSNLTDVVDYLQSHANRQAEEDFYHRNLLNQISSNLSALGIRGNPPL